MFVVCVSLSVNAKRAVKFNISRVHLSNQNFNGDLVRISTGHVKPLAENIGFCSLYVPHSRFIFRARVEVSE